MSDDAQKNKKYSVHSLKKNKSPSFKKTPFKPKNTVDATNLSFYNTTNKKNNTQTVLIRIFVLLFVFITFFVGVFFLFSSFFISPNTPPDISFEYKTTISSEFQTFYSIDSDPALFQEALNKAGKVGTLNEVVVHPPGNKNIKIDARDFFQMFDADAVPTLLLNALTGYYFIGSHTFCVEKNSDDEDGVTGIRNDCDGVGDTVGVAFVAVVDNIAVVNESLRAWEPLLHNTINTLFGVSLVKPSNTFFSDSIQGVTVRRSGLGFDTRDIVYAVTNNGILILATSEKMFSEMLRKINQKQKVIELEI